MIVVNAKICASQEVIAQLRPAVAEMETKTRAEKGCLDYAFSIEVNDPEAVRITEKWESVEALQEHMKSAHMADFQQAAAAHPPRSLEVTFYEASELPSLL